MNRRSEQMSRNNNPPQPDERNDTNEVDSDDENDWEISDRQTEAPQHARKIMVIGRSVLDRFAKNNPDLQHLKIESSSLESIGQVAFFKCINLKTVKFAQRRKGQRQTTISDGLGHALSLIGYRAFFGCSSLENLDPLPRSIQTIDHEAFMGCTSLTKVELSQAINLNNMASGSFAQCTSLKRVDLSACVHLKALDRVFDNCRELECLILPPNLTRLGDFLVTGCKSLTSLWIPASVNDWGIYVFSGCSSLKILQFASVKHLDRFFFQGSSKFLGCPLLHSLEVPMRSLPVKLWHWFLNHILGQVGSMARHYVQPMNRRSIAFNFLRYHVPMYFEGHKQKPIKRTKG